MGRFTKWVAVHTSLGNPDLRKDRESVKLQHIRNYRHTDTKFWYKSNVTGTVFNQREICLSLSVAPRNKPAGIKVPASVTQLSNTTHTIRFRRTCMHHASRLGFGEGLSLPFLQSSYGVLCCLPPAESRPVVCEWIGKPQFPRVTIRRNGYL